MNSSAFGVYRMCQCPLFKQFTTTVGMFGDAVKVFIVCVNVLFLSNSQQYSITYGVVRGVYRMCQCPLFKQFTTVAIVFIVTDMVFIVCVNVLFLSNSQRRMPTSARLRGVYRMCQCPLFKQFTTVTYGVSLTMRCLSYVSMSSF